MGVTLLLDTHALLWALVSPQELSKTARKQLQNRSNTLLVSAASAWEIATKSRLGRLDEAAEVVAGYAEHIERLGAHEAPITSAQALVAGGFALDHRDPFDRMIAAQALLLGVPVVTRDPAFAAFPCRTVW